jgi:hypothetical protein
MINEDGVNSMQSVTVKHIIYSVTGIAALVALASPSLASLSSPDFTEKPILHFHTGAWALVLINPYWDPHITNSKRDSRFDRVTKTSDISQMCNKIVANIRKHADSETDFTASYQSKNNLRTASTPTQDIGLVTNIEIEGNRLIPTADIRGVIKTHVGDQFSRDQLASDLRKIDALGYFDDRTLKVLPERDVNGVRVKITVAENQPVSEFIIVGNKAISKGEIQELLADQLEKPQNLQALASGVARIEQQYHKKGYFDAKVVDLNDDPNGSITVVINEGNHKKKSSDYRPAWIVGSDYPAVGVQASRKATATEMTLTSIVHATSRNSNAPSSTPIGSLPGFSQYNLGGFNGLPGYRMFSDLGSGPSMLMAKTEVRRRLEPKMDSNMMGGFATVKRAVFGDVGEIGSMNTYAGLKSRATAGASVGNFLRLKSPSVIPVRVPKGPEREQIYSGGFDGD